MKTIEALAQWLQPSEQWGTSADRHVSHLTDDSRACQQGCAFIAVTGSRQHGLAFADAAIRAGARLILSDRPPAKSVSIPVWVVPDLARRRAALARWFYDEPDRQLKVIGVTGTNGKSSTVWYVAHLLEALHIPTGVIGTLGQGRYPHLQPGANTTPGAVMLYRTLAEMAAAGLQAVAMEVSSHAIAQGRIEGLHFAATGLTQVTRDHLDFHGTEAAYRAEKARLFTDWRSDVRVLNMDDELGRELAATLPDVVTYGSQSDSHWQIEQMVCTPAGLSGRWCWQGKALSWQVPLLGRFNVENLTCAVTLVTALTGSLEWRSALTGLQPVSGRMERIAARPVVILDYAHTPDALDQVLSSIRAHFPDRTLWVVFGAGGDRDRGKRPLMGEAVSRHADRIVLTSDNPRCEPPEQIMTEVAAGIRHVPCKAIPDRARAIQMALQCARDEDVVVIAGKGHETVQIFCHEQRPFSDREEALKWIRG